MPILYRYLLREMLVPFLVSLFVFTGILFLGRCLQLIDLVVNKNVSIWDIILLFSYLIPGFLELALPMSLLLAVIISLGRLSADSELVVFRSVGLSLPQIARPIMGLALFAAISTAVIGLWIRPWSAHKLGMGLFEIAKQSTASGLLPGTFNQLGQMTIYAEQISEQATRMYHVIIGDRREANSPRTFIAQHGKIIADNAKQTLSLQLFDGSIIEGEGKQFDITNFEINSVRLPQNELLDESPTRSGKRSKEMPFGELTQEAAAVSHHPKIPKEKRPGINFLVEWHRRVALPFSCLCICLTALALGIQPSRGGHTWGPTLNFVFGVAVILAYYLLFALGVALAEQDVGIIWLWIWLPNIVFLALGFYLYRQVKTEKWLAVSEALGDRLRRLILFFSRRTALTS